MASSSKEAAVAGRYPHALTADDNGEGFLFQGNDLPTVSANSKRRFQRKPPHLDMTREYEAAARSYRVARATISTLSERHRQLQIVQEEAFVREQQAHKFTSSFAETRLATCGEPTLNTMSVRIERQRQQAKTAGKNVSTTKPLANKKQREAARREHMDVLVRAAVRRAYGSQELDLKALELVHIPLSAVFTTLLLQFARCLRTVNVARNALRELPESFLRAFPELETLICKENALARLPPMTLRNLRILIASGNQLDSLPAAALSETLEVLDVSRNRLQDVGGLHTLTRLVTLDLSFNHLQLLPCGLLGVSRLQTLSLAGNRLVTLATRPRLLSKRPAEDEKGSQELEEEDERSLWRLEEDPTTHDVVYYHVNSKHVTRVKPKCFRAPQVPPLLLPGHQPQKQVTPQSRELLERFPDGWEIVLPGPGDVSTALRFVNHCSSESFEALPQALDRLGYLEQLQTLVVSGNELQELPPSFARLVRLKRLEAENNKLLMLPDVFQDLKALETVKLGMNALVALPPSFTQLASLTDLDVKFNRLRALPTALGDLKQLRVLDASANALEMLPRSFLELRRLVTLRLAGNAPLLSAGFSVDTLRSGDLKQVRWQLEHQLECEKHGGSRPPEPQARLVGLGAECWSTDLHIGREFARAVERARETQTLAMHWRGLEPRELPSTFFTTLAGLRELRLSGQRFDVLPDGFGGFTELRVLQLRQNEIRVIVSEVFGALEASQDGGSRRLGAATKLEDLDLQHNRLEALPPTFANCSKLRVLSACNNALATLPEPLDGLASCLTDLQLAHNRFTAAPRAVGVLRALERLDLSFNRLETLDTLDFTQLSRLQVLRLSGNRLTDLPPSLGGTPLLELALSGNLFTELPSVVLGLGATLQRLEMRSNRLERLPASFGRALAVLELVESDGNPFRSPPAEIMRLGARAIRVYLLKREQRVEELAALLTTLALPFDRKAFEDPTLRHLLPSTTPLVSLPFLTPQHLAALDRAVDSYVNGAFYLPPRRRGADLLHDLLLQTHFELAQKHHRKVLVELLELLELVRRQRWADKTDLRYDLLRPWGRGGELVGVYNVRASLLFPREEAHGAGADALPSVLRVVETRTQRGFPPEPFVAHKRSAVDVERALEQFVGLFGPVGVAHGHVPMRCGCDELLRVGKMHEPCPQRGWTLLRVLYTDEEASRRELDERRLREAQDALLPQIRAFLETSEGEKRFHREVKHAKDALRTELRALKKRLKRQRGKWKRLKRAHDLEQKLAKKLARAEAKATGSAVKSTESLGELKAREAKREELERAETRVREGSEELARGKARLGQGHAAFRDEVERALLEKVGAAVRQQLVRQQRDKAIAMGWRRPWDGIDGRAFARYQRQIRRHQVGEEDETGAGAAPEDVPKAALPDAKAGKAKAKAKAAETAKAEGDEEEDEGAISDDNSEVSDVSFDGYDDLVATQARRPTIAAPDEEDEEEDEEDMAEAARAAGLAALAVEEEVEGELSDLDDDSDDEKPRESEDSDL
ncbi:hypothetical protein BBJ28_00000320 [Nothophytophthora sp. Chile5]|nr:hypothetical protein BBJ28_00000320 [Nothophytophthora sp. Chile5]